MPLLILLPQVAETTIPEVEDVAAFLHARTKERGGAEVGTFTTLTRPTRHEVEVLIAQAANEVLGKVQTPTPGTDYEIRVRSATALYAAMLVELSFFPDQVPTGRSPYPMLKDLYDERIKALIAEGETGTPQGMGGDGSGSDSPADAAWDFPDDNGGLVGWQTAF